jgi:ferritin-like metal-binding protein YciE
MQPSSPNDAKETVMGWFSSDISTMDDLFVHGLRDIYYAENQILESLPDMRAKATNPQLQQAFMEHETQTQGQVERLRQVFQLHGVEPGGVDCPAIDGIIEEADEIAGEIDDPRVLDAALLAAAQAVEHYEISRYGTLVAWARELGREDCASLLQANLDEEKQTDKLLTQMAEASINPMTSGASSGSSMGAGATMSGSSMAPGGMTYNR